MKSSLVGLAVTAALSAAAPPAVAATTLDFNEFTHGGVVRNLTREIRSGGFTLVTNSGQGFSAWGANHANNADPGGAAVGLWNAGFVTIGRSDSQAFNLLSIDLSDLSNTNSPMDVMFTFFDGAKTTSELFTLDSKRGLETILLNRSNLLWFSMEGQASRAIQFDDMVWDTPVASAVPEPAAWAMMIIGFAGAGVAVRRQRRASVSALICR